MAQEEEPDIISLMAMMEEMAGMPKEELRKRIPGERNMYELSNLRKLDK